nr:hypothetical protein Iba_chr14cCG13650 [Ipomoea batatas]GMD89113.1 hypothetical protein Iba_chr14cCG13660 [Ipomoea batatas]GMD89114.1 hypothetical protein Iba_chr14cCG13670 [Ipomoea batatas]GME09279.1 hypothetical protein Iba_scaffold8522CG0010 [Ipomoea batatas]
MNTQETNVQNQCVQRAVDLIVEGVLDAPVHHEYTFQIPDFHHYGIGPCLCLAYLRGSTKQMPFPHSQHVLGYYVCFLLDRTLDLLRMELEDCIHPQARDRTLDLLNRITTNCSDML